MLWDGLVPTVMLTLMIVLPTLVNMEDSALYVNAKVYRDDVAMIISRDYRMGLLVIIAHVLLVSVEITVRSTLMTVPPIRA